MKGGTPLNRSLYRAMVKLQGKKALNYAIGLTLYNLLLIGVYPSISQSTAVTELSVNLPNSVKHIFGIASSSGLDCFESYVSTQCFGRVWILVMGIYTITMADELIAKLVDQGAMAYLLSSPVGRLEVLTTQAAVLASGLALLTSLTVLGICGEMIVFNIPFAGWSYFHLGVLNFALFLTVGSYSLLFSTLFNNEGQAILTASSLTFLGYALDVISGLNDQFSWLQKLTIFGLVRPQKVLEGEVPTDQALGFLGFSALALTLAGYFFGKKDLNV